ncbi:hypothetical protein LTR28_010905, partial [Elasticomyces elasticus]
QSGIKPATIFEPSLPKVVSMVGQAHRAASNSVWALSRPDVDIAGDPAYGLAKDTVSSVESSVPALSLLCSTRVKTLLASTGSHLAEGEQDPPLRTAPFDVTILSLATNSNFVGPKLRLLKVFFPHFQLMNMPIPGPSHHSDLGNLTNQTRRQTRPPTLPTAATSQPDSLRASMTSEQLPAYADVVKDSKLHVVAEKEIDSTARRGKKESTLRSILTNVVKDRKSPTVAEGEIDGTARRGKKE